MSTRNPFTNRQGKHRSGPHDLSSIYIEDEDFMPSIAKRGPNVNSLKPKKNPNTTRSTTHHFPINSNDPVNKQDHDSSQNKVRSSEKLPQVSRTKANSSTKVFDLFSKAAATGSYCDLQSSLMKKPKEMLSLGKYNSTYKETRPKGQSLSRDTSDEEFYKRKNSSILFNISEDSNQKKCHSNDGQAVKTSKTERFSVDGRTSNKDYSPYLGTYGRTELQDVSDDDVQIIDQPYRTSRNINTDNTYTTDDQSSPYFSKYCRRRSGSKHLKEELDNEEDIWKTYASSENDIPEYLQDFISQSVTLEDSSKHGLDTHYLDNEESTQLYQQNPKLKRTLFTKKGKGFSSQKAPKELKSISREDYDNNMDHVSLLVPKRHTNHDKHLTSKYFSKKPQFESTHKRKLIMESESEDEDENKAEEEPSTPTANESRNENTRPELHMPKPSKLRRNRSTGSFSSSVSYSIQKKALSNSPVTQLKVLKCPYCHEPFESPLPESVADALKIIEQNSRNLRKSKCLTDSSDNSTIQWTMTQKTRKPSTREQYAFCRLHEIELVIKPQGRKENYPENINFDNLEQRILDFKDELDDVIFGTAQSSYRDTALKAYEDLGMNKARSTMAVMARFEATLPGYYGSRGSAIMLDVLSRMYLHTGHLTAELTAPQAPLEYLQQVLIPETGFRLIREDLWIAWQSQKKSFGKLVSKPKRNLSEIAKQRMEESSNYGSMVHPFIEPNIGMSSGSDVESISSSNSVIVLSESDD